MYLKGESRICTSFGDKAIDILVRIAFTHSSAASPRMGFPAGADRSRPYKRRQSHVDSDIRRDKIAAAQERESDMFAFRPPSKTSLPLVSPCPCPSASSSKTCGARASKSAGRTQKKVSAASCGHRGEKGKALYSKFAFLMIDLIRFIALIPVKEILKKYDYLISC